MEGKHTAGPWSWRKKPVEIEAYRFNNKVGSLGARPGWLLAAVDAGTVCYHDDGEAPYLAIDTLEGVMRAKVGDWIIRGVKGELYPCKPDIFAATYEPVEATSPTADHGGQKP